MERQIPIYFDSVIVSSPIQEISGNSSIGRLKVRAFTKYGNRNGSYITDEVAEQLIASATNGLTPVVGFFDPDTKTWASHTGPTLANGYGYVESFLGWEPFTDTDGVSRDYAVFSVVLFTDYFEEAKNIIGQNQSMELDPSSIQGSWTMIEDTEYFVYTTAKMLGFCVIGSHEPCFSVSAFFSKNDQEYKNQYEKFSSLLLDLKARVEETKKNKEGGEKPMNEFEEQEVITPENVEEQIQDESAPQDFEEQEENIESVVEDDNKNNEPSEFEELTAKYNELMANYESLQNDYIAAQARITELETFQTSANEEIESLRTANETLTATISNYESQALIMEDNRKNDLVEKYEKIIEDAEEITVIKQSIKDYSYDELESKLAIIYANQQMAGSESNKVPLPEPPESQFALLMKKYRKN